MKYLITAFFVSAFFVKANAQFYDEVATKLHEQSDLKKDIDLVKKRLEEKNLILYLYISKKDLDYKFDSLKKSITQPITSLKFNEKVLTVLAAIGDGHLSLTVDENKFTPSDMVVLSKPNTYPPIYKFDYVALENKLYIKNNVLKDSTVIAGTEIISINNQPAAKIISDLERSIVSDGYNRTFKRFVLNAGQFTHKYQFLYGYQDSIILKLKYNHTIKEITQKGLTGTYSKNGNTNPQPSASYTLLTADSNVAYLKIRTFMNDASYVGYHGIFSDIKKRGIKTLVLDLRGNTGGSAGWAASIFSFLIDTPTYDRTPDAEVLKQHFTYDIPRLRPWLTDQTKKYAVPPLKPAEDEFHFKGKIYVLINGGSFSAASKLAANIRTLKNVTIVGEETGGSSNVWNAYEMKSEMLPTSKLTFTYGLIATFYGDLTTLTGHGVMPDIPITYTIDDILANKDLEMEWVLKDIAKSSK